MRSEHKAFSLLELSFVILIVGILVSGVIQGNKMYRIFKLTSARTITQSSDAASIKDMIFWMDASQEFAIKNTNNSRDVVDGDYVKTWTDRNPQLQIPLTFSQSSTNYYPIYRESAVNGLPGIEFDGASSSGDYLQVAEESRIAKPKNHTIFAVFSPIQDSSTTNAVGILHKESGTSPDGVTISNSPYSLLFNSTNMKVAGVVMDDTGSNTFIGTSSDSFNNSVSYNTPVIASITHNSVTTSSGYKIYVNGVIKNTGTARTSIGQSQAALYIGRQKNWATDRTYKGYISEIIMYDRVLTTEERNSVEKYLGKKWGITLSY